MCKLRYRCFPDTIAKFETNNISVGNQIKTNIIGSNDYLSKLQQTKNSIQTIQNRQFPKNKECNLKPKLFILKQK